VPPEYLRSIPALETSFDLLPAAVRRGAVRHAAVREDRPGAPEGEAARDARPGAKSLRNLDAIVPKLRELGGRHGAYGAQAEHYPVVGVVLIASMAEVAGDAWLPEYGRAWSDAFEVVAGAMLEGAAA
jgi:hypothetical protein